MAGTGRESRGHTAASSDAAHGGSAVSLGPAPEPPGTDVADDQNGPSSAAAVAERPSLRRQMSGEDLGSAFDLALMARTGSPGGKRSGRRNRSRRGTPKAPVGPESPAVPAETGQSLAEGGVATASGSAVARQSPGARLSSHNLTLVQDIRSALDSLNGTRQASQAKLASRPRRSSAGQATSASSSASPPARGWHSPEAQSRSPMRSHMANGDDESFWWGGDESDAHSGAHTAHTVSPSLADLFAGGGGEHSPLAEDGVDLRAGSPLGPPPDRGGRAPGEGVPSSRVNVVSAARSPLRPGSPALRRRASPEATAPGEASGEVEEKAEGKEEKEEEQEQEQEEQEEKAEGEGADEGLLSPALAGGVAGTAAVAVGASPLPDSTAGAATLRAACARRQAAAQALGLDTAARLLPRLVRSRERMRWEKSTIIARASAPLALLVARTAAAEGAARESLARAQRQEEAARARMAGLVRAAAAAAEAAAEAAAGAVWRVQHDRAASAWAEVGGGGGDAARGAPDPEDVDEAVAAVALLVRAMRTGWGEDGRRALPHAAPRPWSALGAPQCVSGRVSGPVQRWDRRRGWQDRVCVLEEGRLSLFPDCGPSPDPLARPRAVLTVAAASVSLEPASELPVPALEGMLYLARLLPAQVGEALPYRAGPRPAAAEEEGEGATERAARLSLAALQRLPEAPSLWSAELETEHRAWTLRFPTTLAAAQWARLLAPLAAERCPDTAALAASAGWVTRLATGRDVRLIPGAGTVLGCPAVSTVAEEMARGESSAAAVRDVFAGAVPRQRLAPATCGAGSCVFGPLALAPAPASAPAPAGSELAATAAAADAGREPEPDGEYTVMLTRVPFGLLLRPSPVDGAVVRATRGAAAEDGRVAVGHAVVAVDGEWVADEPFEAVVDRLRQSRPPCRVTLRPEGTATGAKAGAGASPGGRGPAAASPRRSSSATSEVDSESGGEGELEVEIRS